MKKSIRKKVFILSIVFLLLFSNAQAGALPPFMSLDVSNIKITRNYHGVNQMTDYGDAVKLGLKVLTKTDLLKVIAVASIVAPNIDEKYYARLDHARTGLLISDNEEMLTIPNKQFKNYFSLMFDDEILVGSIPQDISAARLMGFLKLIDSNFIPSITTHFTINYAPELIKVMLPRLKSTKNEDIMVGGALLSTSVQRFELSSKDTKKLATAMFNTYKQDESLKKVLLSLIWTDSMDTDNQYDYIKTLLSDDINFTIKSVTTWLYEDKLVKLSINGYKGGNKKDTFDLEIAEDTEERYFKCEYRYFDEEQETTQIVSFEPKTSLEGIETYACNYEQQQYIDGDWKIIDLVEAVFEHDTRMKINGLSNLNVSIKSHSDIDQTYEFKLNYAYDLENNNGNLTIITGTSEDNIHVNLELIMSTSNTFDESLIGEMPDFNVIDAYELSDEELAGKGDELLSHFYDLINNLKRLPLMFELL